MTVVFITLAVELDHLDDVFFIPKDVVVEEAITIVGGLFCNLRGSDRAVPHKWGNIVKRLGGSGELLEGSAEASYQVNFLFVLQPIKHVVVLDINRDDLTIF